eukprot:6184617-Pleurochrysis_carterae.AAC.1
MPTSKLLVHLPATDRASSSQSTAAGDQASKQAKKTQMSNSTRMSCWNLRREGCTTISARRFQVAHRAAKARQHEDAALQWKLKASKPENELGQVTGVPQAVH